MIQIERLKRGSGGVVRPIVRFVGWERQGAMRRVRFDVIRVDAGIKVSK